MTPADTAAPPEAALKLPDPEPVHRWFSEDGCLVLVGSRREVRIAGRLLDSFEADDLVARDLVLIALTRDPTQHLGRLGDAFDLSPEGLRRIRQRARKHGVGALVVRRPRGRPRLVSARHRAQLESAFAAGLGVEAARAELQGKRIPSTRTVARIFAELRRQRGAPPAPIAAEASLSAQTSLALPEQPATPSGAPSSEAPIAAEAKSQAETPQTPSSPPSSSVDLMEEFAKDEDRRGNCPTDVRSGPSVQHLGGWLMLAMLWQLGFYASAVEAAGERVAHSALRIVLDAVAIGLSLGEKTVEGVRRLLTPTVGLLLRAHSGPSATWSRRVLGRFSTESASVALHQSMAQVYLAEAAASAKDRTVVAFYIDNHLRPYTGQAVIRHGWRMQDKRAVPGSMDYYLHDEDGRSLMRINTAANESLTTWLPRIAQNVREILGDHTRFILGFDRGGAFAEHLAGLRDEGFEFVTYERKPYRLLPASAFKKKVHFGNETLAYCESRKNLGHGRGRLRRIAVCLPDGKQINLLAWGKSAARRFIEVMRGRWCQENGIRHDVERWGINQLDGRKTTPYGPDEIIPNPARRRLDRAIRMLQAREGRLRNQAAALPTTATPERRAEIEAEIRRVVGERQQQVALRPATPEHARVADTELAETLVKHPDEYKRTLDTLRIACGNAEADLAQLLAQHLPRPGEAKRALHNLFMAPGDVRVLPDRIEVHLRPAGTRPERAAFGRLLDEVSGWHLRLPGDERARALRFTSQL
jgi:hypothetical protein